MNEEEVENESLKEFQQKLLMIIVWNSTRHFLDDHPKLLLEWSKNSSLCWNYGNFMDLTLFFVENYHHFESCLKCFHHLLHWRISFEWHTISMPLSLLGFPPESQHLKSFSYLSVTREYHYQIMQRSRTRLRARMHSNDIVNVLMVHKESYDFFFI